VEGTLAEVLAWLEPRALLLALAMPPIVRLIGHILPEEVFMVSMGVLASRSGSPSDAAVLLVALIASQFLTDQAVYLGGRWLRPRLGRFPRIRKRLEFVTGRLSSSPTSLLWFIPARVFPLARGAWLAGCGVVGVTWRRFMLIDFAALTVPLFTWCGLGWWLADDLNRLEATTHAGKFVGVWVAFVLLSTTLAWLGWRHRNAWQPATVRVARFLGRSLFQSGRNDRL
jgi:membrane protein DedA with SNARE-associated domain